MRLLVAAAVLVSPVLAQQAVTSTRTFTDEVFPGLTPYIEFYVGLENAWHADGNPVHVEIDLAVELDLRWILTNTWDEAGNFYFYTPLTLTSEICDCSEYNPSQGIGAVTEPVDPGESTLMTVQDTVNYYWAGADWPLASGTWFWHSAWIWPSIVCGCGQPRLVFGNCAPVLGDAFFPFVSEATVNGHMTAEWIPNELPHWSVCDGNADSVTTLTPAGDWERLWLMQTGVPTDHFNLLIRNTTASNVIPENGLCIAQGGGVFSRMDGSLSLGGEPFYFGSDPALSGTVHYFQSWFRTDQGPRTGECIGVSVP